MAHTWIIELQAAHGLTYSTASLTPLQIGELPYPSSFPIFLHTSELKAHITKFASVETLPKPDGYARVYMHPPRTENHPDFDANYIDDQGSPYQEHELYAVGSGLHLGLPWTFYVPDHIDILRTEDLAGKNPDEFYIMTVDLISGNLDISIRQGSEADRGPTKRVFPKFRPSTYYGTDDPVSDVDDSEAEMDGEGEEDMGRNNNHLGVFAAPAFAVTEDEEKYEAGDGDENNNDRDDSGVNFVDEVVTEGLAVHENENELGEGEFDEDLGGEDEVQESEVDGYEIDGDQSDEDILGADEVAAENDDEDEDYKEDDAQQAPANITTKHTLATANTIATGHQAAAVGGAPAQVVGPAMVPPTPAREAQNATGRVLLSCPYPNCNRPSVTRSKNRRTDIVTHMVNQHGLVIPQTNRSRGGHTRHRLNRTAEQNNLIRAFFTNRGLAPVQNYLY